MPMQIGQARIEELEVIRSIIYATYHGVKPSRRYDYTELLCKELHYSTLEDIFLLPWPIKPAAEKIIHKMIEDILNKRHINNGNSTN